MTKKNPAYTSRKFLNKKNGIAAIVIDGTLKDGFDISMSDCNRGICLDFFHYGDEDRKKDYKDKINTLISELEKARDFYFGE